jgi:hypothetical protein
MTAPAKKTTAAEIRAQIEHAEESFHAVTVALGEALVVQLAVPDRDVSGEQAAVDAARLRVSQLKAMLPLFERAEAEALAATRAKLAEEQRKLLERALRDLLKHSLSFSVHYQNAASAFRRMTAAGDNAARLLFEPQRRQGNGYFPGKLCESGLRAAADIEINRLGLRPAFESAVSAPGTDRTRLPSVEYTNAPQRLPALEAEIRKMTALIMASAPEPLPALQESE